MDYTGSPNLCWPLGSFLNPRCQGRTPKVVALGRILQYDPNMAYMWPGASQKASLKRSPTGAPKPRGPTPRVQPGTLRSKNYPNLLHTNPKPTVYVITCSTYMALPPISPFKGSFKGIPALYWSPVEACCPELLGARPPPLAWG